jgi:hypothetical protein
VSRDALIAAGESMSAFDPTPMPDSLAVCLKPYEQLVPGCNLETEIRQTVAGYGRVGLVGGIGCGKSGVSRYALGGPGLGMIALNVVTEDREKIATVRGFLEILVAQLLSRATAASRLSGEVRERLLAGSSPTEALPRTEIRTRAELGGALWLLNGGVAREVTRTLGGSESYRSTHDLRQAARDALDAISASDVPVLLADDTDRLLAIAGDDARATRCSAASSARSCARSQSNSSADSWWRSTTATATARTTLGSQRAASRARRSRGSPSPHSLRRSSIGAASSQSRASCVAS